MFTGIITSQRDISKQEMSHLSPFPGHTTTPIGLICQHVECERWFTRISTLRLEGEAVSMFSIISPPSDTSNPSIPGNDDSGAMAALLAFHLLGLYPVPATTQLLIGSPFLSSYTLTSYVTPTEMFNTTVRVVNFDPQTLVQSPPNGTNLYVQSVTVDGTPSKSRCWIDFWTLLESKEVVIEVGQDPGMDVGCGSDEEAVPASLEAGGFGNPVPIGVKPPNV